MHPLYTSPDYVCREEHSAVQSMLVAILKDMCTHTRWGDTHKFASLRFVNCVEAAGPTRRSAVCMHKAGHGCLQDADRSGGTTEQGLPQSAQEGLLVEPGALSDGHH